MSHIETTSSIGIGAECFYSERAFAMARFYKSPMVLRIKELRKEKGWTQSALADRAAISRSQLAMIESEARPANTLRLNAIATALGVATEDLFGPGSEDRQLLDKLSALTPEDRATVVRLVEALAASASKD